MTPKKILYKKEYAKELLRIAKGDLESAEKLFAAKGGRPENVCFLAQQVIEKSIKAVLCHGQIPYSHTHDLGTLIELLPKNLEPLPLGYDLSVLNEYATIRLYEDGIVDLKQEDVEAVIDIAKKSFFWGTRIIG